MRIAQKYEGMKQREVMEKFGLSRSSIYRILKGFKRLKSCDGREKSKGAGAPWKLSIRQERLLLRNINNLRREDGNVTFKRLMDEASINVTSFLQNTSFIRMATVT